jgi:uncharacterized membrane protein (GlpM family)
VAPAPGSGGAPGDEPLVGIHAGALRHVPVRGLAIRFAFGAAISVVAGVISIAAGSEPGGILLAFPAILPATLTLVEKEESERKAEDLDVGSVLGAAALAAFAVVVWRFVGRHPAPVVLSLATLAWVAAAVILYLGLRLLFHRHVSLRRSVGDAPGDDPVH